MAKKHRKRSEETEADRGKMSREGQGEYQGLHHMPQASCRVSCSRVSSLTAIWSFCLLETEQLRLREVPDGAGFRFQGPMKVVDR